VFFVAIQLIGFIIHVRMFGLSIMSVLLTSSSLLSVCLSVCLSHVQSSDLSPDKHVEGSCVFLLVSTCSTVCGHRLFEDARARLHHVATGLL